jgi:hypothetical protein
MHNRTLPEIIRDEVAILELSIPFAARICERPPFPVGPPRRDH